MKNNRLGKGKSYNRHQQVILEVNYKNQVTLEPKKSQSTEQTILKGFIN